MKVKMYYDKASEESAEVEFTGVKKVDYHSSTATLTLNDSRGQVELRPRHEDTLLIEEEDNDE